MALSGSFKSSQVTDVGDYPSYVYVNWSAEQDTNKNQSKITWACYGGSYYNNAYRWTTTGPVVVTINGQVVLNKTGRFNMTQGMLLDDGVLIVPHNADGTKSVNVSISAAIYYGTTSSSYSGKITLDPIPRKSEITVPQSATIGNKCNIKWTPASKNFVYTLEFSLDNWSTTTDYISPQDIKEYTYTGFTIPTDLYSYITDAPDAMMTATLYTYSSKSTSALIGKSKQKSFKVLVPSSVKPTGGTVKLEPLSVPINGTNYSYLIQGVNKLKISVSGVSAGTGSQISSYTFSGPSADITQSSNTVTVGPITTNKVGPLKYSVTVKDTRDSAIVLEKEFTDYYTYSAPSITLKVTRKQKTVTCTYTPLFSSINGKNSAKVQIYADGVVKTTIQSVSNSTAATATFDLDNATKSYEIYAVITDGLGNTGKSNRINVNGLPRVINITSDGTGVAFGKFAENKNCVDVPKLMSRGNIEITTNGRGLHIKNSKGTVEPAIHRNTDNTLWIGAKNGSAGHITGGGTYISTGENKHLWVSKPTDSGRNNFAVLDTQNWETYLSMVPTVLWSNSSGSKGTITLNSKYNVSNYDYLEIFYCEDNSYPAHQSVRYSRGMGDRFDISSIEATPTGGYVYLRTTRYNIEGQSIKFARSKYVTITSNTTGDIKTPIVTESDSTTDNKFKITKIIGYTAVK